MTQRRRKMRLLAIASLAAVALATMSSQAFAGTPAPSTTAVAASPDSAAPGDEVVLIAEVSCSADPSEGLGVSFYDRMTLLGTVQLNSREQAVLSLRFYPVGEHEIMAAYNGNEECEPSVGYTTMEVTESPDPSAPPSNSDTGQINLLGDPDNPGLINTGR
ncbi:MAG: Ig-like domain-containing protein [Micromonosporaceae bacterium]